MKVNIPEPVAVGALAALQALEVAHPDVRHLVRELKTVVDGRTANDVLSGDELGAVLIAVDAALTSNGDNLVIGLVKKSAPLLRTARPKLEKLHARQALRERGAK